MATALPGNGDLGSTHRAEGSAIHPSLRGPGALQQTVEMGFFGPLLPGARCPPWESLARLEPGPVCWVRLPWVLWIFRASQDA